MHNQESLSQNQTLHVTWESILSTSSSQEPTIAYSFLEGRHELRVWVQHPSQEQIETLLKTSLDLALFVQKEVMILLCRFGKETWQMSPFQWHHIPQTQRVKPDLWSPAQLEIVFLDTQTEQTCGHRIVPLGPEFTTALGGTILLQASSPWSGEGAYQHVLQQLQQKYPTPDKLVPLATARTLDIP